MSAQEPGVVRPANVTDAPAIGATHWASHRETYAGLLSPAFFAGRDEARYVSNWARALERADRPAPVVAEVAGDVVGFAEAGPSRDEPPVRPLELTTLYVRAAWHGTGLGQRLLDAVLGDRPASLWVAEENPRARRFYERNGFVLDGAREVLASWEGIAEVRMVR